MNDVIKTRSEKKVHRYIHNLRPKATINRSGFSNKTMLTCSICLQIPLAQSCYSRKSQECQYDVIARTGMSAHENYGNRRALQLYSCSSSAIHFYALRNALPLNRKMWNDPIYKNSKDYLNSEFCSVRSNIHMYKYWHWA